MLYLGIDQHAKQLTINLRNEAGDVVLKRQQHKSRALSHPMISVTRLKRREGG